MDNNIAAGTAQAGQSAAFSLLRSKPVTGARWRAVARLAITLLLLALGAGLHLSSSGGHWLISPLTARADNIQYVYDELGRVIQATDQTTGQAVLYTYDAVGNITSQTTTALTTLSIGYFTPNHGPIGTQVTITGTGFSATSSADAVTFNGVSATVVSATQTQLVVTVPSSATSGSIGVTVGSASAASSEPFTVTAVGDAPVITGLDPAVGVAGQLVTVLGTGFDSQPVNDRVQFNATSAQVTFSTSTAITTSVPAGSNSGKVLLVTPRGMAISPMDFIVVPSGYSAGSIGTTGRMPTDGSTTSITIPTANHIGVELFNGQVGDLLTIGVSSTTLASATIKVFDPDGNLLTSGTVTASGQGVQLPALQLGGTYTIVVDPGSNTGNIALNIVRPFVGTLTLNGAATAVTLSPPGQRALLTFSGSQGTYANLSLSAVTVSAGTVSLIAPNGAVVDSKSFTISGASLQPQLPATGTYTVLINPTGSVGGSLSVAVTTSSTPSLSTNQGYSLSLANTTPVTVAFDGSAGQYLALTAATTASTVGSYSLKVLAPDGSQVNTGTLSTSSNAGSVVLNLGPLPVGGTYSVVVQANSSGSGAVALTLSTPLTGVLAGTGSSTGVSISTPGQGLLYTASLSAGQYASFALAESLSNPGRINAAAITVLRPDGTILSNGTLATSFDGCSSNPCLGATGYYGSTVVNIGPLPESGTYSFLVQQTGTGSLDTGTLSMTLSPVLTGTLAVNSATNVGLGSPGQGLMYSFAGTAGQYLTLGLLESNDNIPGAVVAVFNPDGTVLGTGAMTTTSCTGTGCPSGPYSGTGVVSLGTLPMTGTYTVLVLQISAGTGTLILAPSTPATGTLTAGTPSNVQAALPGQPIEMTFSGIQGQYESLAVQESAGGTIPSANVKVLNPDSSVLTTGTLTTTGSCSELTCAGYSGSSVVNFGPLPATGTYTVLVQQVTGTTGGLTLTLAAAVTGSLNSSSNFTASLPGQSLALSFNGSPGQYLGLGLQETYDNLPGASIKILNPDGTVLNTGTFTTTACNGFGCPGVYSGTGQVNIGPLRQMGTYTVLIQQTAAGTGALEVILSSPADGGMLTPGSPLILSASVLGQPVQAEFTGTAGSAVTLNVQGSSAAQVTVLSPDGTPYFQGTYCNTSGCSGTSNFYPNQFTTTGTYTLILQLKSTGTASFTVTANGVSSSSGGVSSTNSPSPGQPATQTFTGVAGQYLSLALTNTTETPSPGPNMWLEITEPDGTLIYNNYWSASSAGLEWAPLHLPESGTYTTTLFAPAGEIAGFTQTLSATAVGDITVGSTVSVNLPTMGQSAIYNFEATAGQSVTLYVGGITTTPANTQMNIEVVNSSGTSITATTVNSYATFELANLAAGTYGVYVFPAYPCTSSFQMTLQPASIGTIPVNGTVTNFSTSALRQTADMQFSGTAGQQVSLALNNVVMTPGTTNEYWLQLNKPDGTAAWAGWWFTYAQGFEWAPYALPESGTYTLSLYPSDPETLTATATVSADVIGTLPIGNIVNVSLPTTGQSAAYSFTATEGQSLALSVGGITTTPANTSLQATVYNSSGAVVGATQTTNSNAIFNLNSLAADTYTVFIAPQYPCTSTLTITLQPGSVASLSVNGSSTAFNTTELGQNVYLSFFGNAGESVSVAFDNLDIQPPYNSITYWLQIDNPDGSASYAYWFWNNGDGAGFVWPMWVLPQTGLYSITFYPNSGYAQSLSGAATVSSNVTGSLTVGAPVGVNLPELGQGAMYTFTAVAGQNLTLNVSSVATIPVNTALNVAVVNSAGTVVSQTKTSTSATLSLTNLAADTYSVRVSPALPCTSTLQIALQQD